MVSKKQVEFVKDDVIGYIVTEHSQNDKRLKLLGETQILPE